MKRYGPIDGEGAGLVCCFGGFARAEAELTTATSQHGLWRTSFTQTKVSLSRPCQSAFWVAHQSAQPTARFVELRHGFS